jgi:hypothetical protein
MNKQKKIKNNIDIAPESKQKSKFSPKKRRKENSLDKNTSKRGKQNYQLIDYDSRETTAKEPEIVVKTNISLLSSNMIGYIADYLDINETFQLLDVNKKFRRSLIFKKTNNHIEKLVRMLSLLNSLGIKKITDILVFKEDIFSSRILNSELKHDMTHEQILDSLKFAVLILSKNNLHKKKIQLDHNLDKKFLISFLKIFKVSYKERLGKIFKLDFSIFILNYIDFTTDLSNFENKVDFINYFTFNFSIDTIQIFIDRISDTQAKYLSKIFKYEVSGLKTLIYNNKTLSDLVTSKIFKNFNSNIQLKKIDLSRSKVSNLSASAFAKIINNCPELEELKFWSNKLGNEGVRIITDSLKSKFSNKKCFLKELDFGENQVGDEGATAIASFLIDNNSLKFLNLGRNFIQSQGAVALAEALKKNNSLNKISFSNNEIGTEGANALADALKVNHSLKEFYIRRNKFGVGGEKLLKLAVESKTHNKAQLFLYPEKKYYYNYNRDY